MQVMTVLFPETDVAFAASQITTDARNLAKKKNKKKTKMRNSQFYSRCIVRIPV